MVAASQELYKSGLCPLTLGDLRPLHMADRIVAVVDGIVQGATVVPKGDGAGTPAKAAGEFRAYSVGI